MTADHGLDQPDLLVSAAGLGAAHTRMSEDEAERLVARYGGLPGHATRLATEKDDTFAIRAGDHRAYILKVANPAEDPLEVDVATALLNQLPQVPPDPSVDIFADGSDLLRGYLSVADLTGTELAAIPYLVLGRVIARALITSYRAALLPSNAAYVLRNTPPGWGQLRWFRDQPDDRLTALLERNLS